MMSKKVKTLLLNLPINIHDVSDYNGVLQPVGLAGISSFLKQHHCDVTLYDAFAHHNSSGQILHLIKELHPHILGTTLFTAHLYQAIPFLEDVKQILPDIITVVGGAHPSSDYEHLQAATDAIDIAVIGEGEHTMYEIIKSVEEGTPLSQIKGIAYKEDGAIRLNSFREYIQDLDTLPFLDWASLPMENYWEVLTVKKNYAHMILSRGCPFGCTFCGAKKALGRKQRKRSPNHVLEEITLLYDKYHVRNILFGDSTLNIDNEWLRELCEGLLQLNRPIIWNCNLRADQVDRDSLKLMKKSGCLRAFIGVESADNSMLKRMKKGVTIEKIEEGIRLMQEAGIHPDMGFILGMPGETEETMQKSVDFAKKYPKSVCTFTLAAPFPDTPLYEEAQKEGFMIDDWSKCNIYSIAYVPRGLTKETLERYYKNAVRTTYFRPLFILYQLLHLKSWLNFKITLRFAYRIFFKRLLALKE